ncbi:hypothetical protein CY34DRAFT_58669, partial [Suillus luteus UH-Slu-Lm8-n1]
NINFATIKLAPHLKDQLPAWLHMGVPPRTYNNICDACLQNNHKVKSIKDLKTISNRLTNTTDHHKQSNCACKHCKHDRNIGCSNLNKCATIASKIITSLKPKFNPTVISPKDNLMLTHHRKEKNKRAHRQRTGDIIFNPMLTKNTTLGDCFRTF